MLMKATSQSLTEQLSSRFAQRIRDRLLAPGARLPSVRQCAQQQGVSPSTVVAAYDQLLAQGLVEARKNRGFFVRESQPEAVVAPAPRAPKAPQVSGAWATATGFTTARSYAPIDATALIRGMFHKVSNKPQPGMGVFPPEWLESTFMPAAVRKVTSTKALFEFSLQYGEPLGDASLRRALSKKLATLNVHAGPDNIITTVGATHALDIVSRSLLRPGDPVMVEEPGWAVEFARLTALGMRLLPVPRRADGPDLEVMARTARCTAPSCT
jgi:DNA-binding transcriptional MocR family regulator